jgi:hypothetical protein
VDCRDGQLRKAEAEEPVGQPKNICHGFSLTDADQRKISREFREFTRINTQHQQKNSLQIFADGPVLPSALALSALAPKHSLASFGHLNLRGTIELAAQRKGDSNGEEEAES